jgi:Tol biopolymer transport system component
MKQRAIVALLIVLMSLSWQDTARVGAQDAPTAGAVQLFELPEGRAISMSPDGAKLAAVLPPSTSLCVYDVATQTEISCADLSGLNSGIRSEEVVWSPDSTRLAFGETSFLTFKDGDLWVMDAQTGVLTNLTDDGYDGSIMLLSDDEPEGTYSVDIAPAWTPDSASITFSRTEFQGGIALGNSIAQIAADGSGEVQTLVQVRGTEPGIVYFGTDWSPDGALFYYSVLRADPDDPDSGIWVYDKATGATRQLAVSDDPEAGVLALEEVSPAGDRLLAYYPNGLAQMMGVQKSMLRFVDPVTGALSPVPEPDPAAADNVVFASSWIATFSPDGQYFLQLTGIDSGSRAVWVTNLTTNESTRVIDAIEQAVPIDYALGPVWGTNGTVFISHNVTGAYFIPIEGVGLSQSPDTATAASTPVASPQAATPVAGVPVSGAPVGGTVQNLDLPKGRAVALSPDGQMVAAVEPNTSICIYDAQTVEQISCADASGLNSGIRTEDIVWSPDSTRLAFSEQVFRYFNDGDLWVMNAQTGALTNITDDHYDGPVVIGADEGASYFADVAPAWTPDSQFITFSRTTFVGSQSQGNTVAQAPAAGGEVETLATVSAEEPGVFYFGGGWSPDGASFYYSVSHTDSDDPDNGIWVYDPATGGAHQLAASDPDLGPLALLEVSPAGDRLLGWYPLAAGTFGMSQEGLLTLVDAATGALNPLPDPSGNGDASWIATFSPDGQYLLHAAGIDVNSLDYWVTDLASGQSTEVASDLALATPIELGLGPVWASNGTVFVARSLTGYYLFPIEGAGLSAISQTTLTQSATPASSAGTLPVGADAITIGIAPLFAGPDTESPLVVFLPPNHIVRVLADPVESDEGIWYPVFDPGTQVIGYLQANRLAALETNEPEQ